VLKGTSLIVHYYQDYGVRPMNDFDFLVPTSRAPEAVALLRRLGWQPQLKHPDRSLEAYLSVTMPYTSQMRPAVTSTCIGMS